MNASKILETLKAYLKDRKFDEILKIILANLDNFTNGDKIDYY